MSNVAQVQEKELITVVVSACPVCSKLETMEVPKTAALQTPTAELCVKCSEKFGQY